MQELRATLIDPFRKARFGVTALFLLVAGFCVDFVINGREDMYCFSPPAHNVAYHVGQVVFFTMVAGGIASLIGLRIDRTKRYALITVACFLPLLLIDALRMGCN